MAVADNLFTRFAAAAQDPQKPLLTVPGAKAISYGEAFASAAQFAQVLTQHGLVPGDRVAVQVEKSPAALILYLACLRAGLVYLPLNSGYTLTELAYFVQDASPRLFVAAVKNLQGMAAVVPSLDFLTLSDDGLSGSLIAEAQAAPRSFADAPVGMQDLASILYTSGTTGRSKGAMLAHGNLHSNAEALKQTWAFTADDVLLHALPIFHIHGLFVATNVAMLSGASMLFLPKFEPDAVFAALPDATVMMGVPTFYTRLLKDVRLSPETTGHMRLFISGSAPLLPETFKEWQARTGQTILERYGMSETNMNTSNPYRGERIAGSVGLPLPGVEVRIADSEGKPLAQGEIGMIEIRGPNVFQGYWKMPEKTAAEFRADGFFITGDMGTIEPDGYLRIVGRGKDLIITGGLNVYPREIEAMLDELPEVEESAVVGLPHEDFGEGVTAFVIAREGAALTEEKVQAALHGRLARFKQPKRVLFLTQLPRNTMGKVQKAALREDYKNLYR
jgi:malonyl-CoA/methylmalonyl-CoA synthetase